MAICAANRGATWLPEHEARSRNDFRFLVPGPVRRVVVLEPSVDYFAAYLLDSYCNLELLGGCYQLICQSSEISQAITNRRKMPRFMDAYQHFPPRASRKKGGWI